jgi:hypothetical protein
MDFEILSHVEAWRGHEPARRGRALPEIQFGSSLASRTVTAARRTGAAEGKRDHATHRAEPEANAFLRISPPMSISAATSITTT